MNTHFPSLDFDLGEEIEMLREAVYQFARAEIAPPKPGRTDARRRIAPETDEFGMVLRDQLADMGHD